MHSIAWQSIDSVRHAIKRKLYFAVVLRFPFFLKAITTNHVMTARGIVRVIQEKASRKSSPTSAEISPKRLTTANRVGMAQTCQKLFLIFLFILYAKAYDFGLFQLLTIYFLPTDFHPGNLCFGRFISGKPQIQAAT